MWIIFLIINIVAIEITFAPRFGVNNITKDLLLFYNSNKRHQCRKYIIVWKNINI